MLLLPAGNPGPLTGRGNNTWLLDGPRPTLIDAGTGVPAHLDAIAGALDGRPLAQVLATHGHSDHIGGANRLRDRWPQVELRKHTPPDETVWRPLIDGEVVHAGDILLRIVHTPGHAPDHVCFFDEASGDLFAGDMVIRGSSVLVPFGKGGDLRAYLASLERMAALRPARLLPAHGPVIDRPAEIIAEYLAHRRQREEQVLACLADGVHDLDALVSRIYPEIPATIRWAARLTVAAHLDKLRQEGRLEWPVSLD